MRALGSIPVLLALAGAVWGQDPLERGGVDPAVWRAWTPSAATYVLGGRSPLPARLVAAASGASLAELAVPIDPFRQELAYVLDVRPVWVHREDLEGAKEERQRFERLPGGIVLGLSASVRDPLARARVARDPAGGIVLVDANGRALALPPVDPELLEAAIEFVGSGDGSDTLIDCTSEALRVAPAFRGGDLERLIVRADRTPHRHLPRTALWKSVIVDRAVTVELRAGTVFMDADLEVRFYGRGRDEADPSARVLTLALEDGADRSTLEEATLEEPATPEEPADDALSALSADLAPLAEIAGWLGFLRWAEAQDPQGFRALRGAPIAAPGRPF